MNTETKKRDQPQTVAVPIASRDQGPHVEVVRDGDVITTIRVTCSCGAAVDIACEYSQALK